MYFYIDLPTLGINLEGVDQPIVWGVVVQLLAELAVLYNVFCVDAVSTYFILQAGVFNLSFKTTVDDQTVGGLT